MQTPIDLSSLYKEPTLVDEHLTVVPTKTKQMNLNELQVLVQAKVEENQASLFTLTLNGEKERLHIEFDRVKQEVRVDRTDSGNVAFSEHFPSIDRMPLSFFKDFTLIVDQSSIELFINDGSSVMTELFYPLEQTYTLEWKAMDGEITFSNVTINEIKSTWK
ncbi:GH32 C-terminal domain-containing protein [Halalkalibacter krulwichiae]|uniref:GH32 C-terminal domain-containing protein n=1 Tax=Halalkalibacter krulwichiae TaxID=199441 RepID=UPI003F76F6DC